MVGLWPLAPRVAHPLAAARKGVPPDARPPTKGACAGEVRLAAVTPKEAAAYAVAG